MKGLHLIIKDLKLMWHHKHGRIALIFLILVPLIYSGFFLAGYWNPYGRLDKLPVAVVNLDQGAEMDGKPIHAGKDFVDHLRKSKDLNFQFVSQEKANKGIKNGTYYMTLTIPKNFSKKVTTLTDDHPQQTKLIYKINPGKNFVASQISTTAIEKMKTKLSNQITKSYAESVFSKFQVVADGLQNAGNGASKLNEGTITEKNGMDHLSIGIHELNNGSQKLKDGSNKLVESEKNLNQAVNGLNTGSSNLANGMEQLVKGYSSLDTGMEQLSTGTQSLEMGNAKLVKGQTAANSTADALNSALELYVKNHSDAANDPEFQQLLAKSAALVSITDSLQTGQTELVKGVDLLVQGEVPLKAGMETFGSKLREAANGAQKLSDGTVLFTHGLMKWEKGFDSLHNGIIQLADGGTQLDNGSDQLTNGLSHLTSGSTELATKLTDAAEKTSTLHNNDALTTMFAEPVKLAESKLSDVPNYGTGITPYFLSLALYVGGIMAANILPLGRRQDRNVNGTVHFINKLGLKISIGLIQTIFVDLVILFGFKVHVASVPLFILSSFIVSFTFMTFILMLVTLFGVAGKFLAVTLLVLQLATCGGTFPGELSNPILSTIGRYLPMAHSLRGFQDVISLGDWSQLEQQIIVLLLYLVITGAIAWFTSHVQHAKLPAEGSH
ncbi:YhgE/Pip domain-containing protein [Bacillus sp. JJ1764]|uniref:YhgE/Pip domain-containing protein n=1 Tax=Bacillus sp. JJ1764 TaxID=3122964 RepID=UPI002FFD7EBB